MTGNPYESPQARTASRLHVSRDGSVIIGPRWFTLLRSTIQMFGGALLALFGVVIMGFKWPLTYGWIPLLVVGLQCAWVLLSAAIWRRPRIEINGDGFVVHYPFKKVSRRWIDIDGDFTATKFARRSAVGYRLTKACKKASGIKPPTIYGNFDEIIPDVVRVSPIDLADLLNQHKPKGTS